MFMAYSTLYEMTISVVCSVVSLLYCLYFGQLSYLPAHMCNSESVIKFNNNNNNTTVCSNNADVAMTRLL